VANQEQELRERDKREKRVYDNWRRLIRGLLIRERLQAKHFRNDIEDDVPPVIDGVESKIGLASLSSKNTRSTRKLTSNKSKKK
jgi:xeroderma pigmentosum group C-complementing protein